jgi:hypothetical protein
MIADLHFKKNSNGTFPADFGSGGGIINLIIEMDSSSSQIMSI